jgi:5'-3' exonuclease
MRALIDADQMVYACGFATDGEPLENALHLVNKQIEYILDETGSTDFTVYIKGKGNFRDELYEPYKGTRAGHKPEHYEEIRDHLHHHWGAQYVDGMEADDAVSIDHWQLPEDTVIVSPDKDLNNTPGLHFNPQKGRLYTVSDEQAERHFLFQMLCGDKVDNIPGVRHLNKSLCKDYKWHPSVGEVTAKKMMEMIKDIPISSQWSFVEVIYKFIDSEYLDGDTPGTYMQLQQKLLWMCRGTKEADADYVLPWFSTEAEVEYWEDKLGYHA